MSDGLRNGAFEDKPSDEEDSESTTYGIYHLKHCLICVYENIVFHLQSCNAIYARMMSLLPRKIQHSV